MRTRAPVGGGTVTEPTTLIATLPPALLVGLIFVPFAVMALFQV